MFNVFTQHILTSKGKVCIRTHESTRDAQKTYSALLSVYQDDLSTQLLATTLRSELTVLSLDEKWRSTYEQFLTTWTTKIQDLKNIEDKPIDEDTKRIWLTNTLQGHRAMTAAVRTATTTELTLSSMTTTTSASMTNRLP